jgi:hypothetical protein
MTTIVATARGMAGDTFVYSQASGYYTQKIVRVGDSLIGCAGPSTLCQQFINWRVKGLKGPVWSLNDPFEALILDKTGIYVFTTASVPDRVKTPFFAIGSGRQYALGALASGASLRASVVVACKFDPYSKEPIETFKL